MRTSTYAAETRSRAVVRVDRGEPCGDLVAAAKVELAQDATDVRIDGAFSRTELDRDLAVGQPARHQLGDGALARRQRRLGRRVEVVRLAVLGQRSSQRQRPRDGDVERER